MAEIKTEVVLDAPPEKVWEKLVAFDRHHTWFTKTKVHIPLQVGAKGTVKLIVPGLRLSSPITMQIVNHARHLQWIGMPPGMGWFMRGEHYFILEPLPGGKTKMIHGEKFSGVGVNLVFWFLGPRIEQIYQELNEALAGAVRA